MIYIRNDKFLDIIEQCPKETCLLELGCCLNWPSYDTTVKMCTCYIVSVSKYSLYYYRRKQKRHFFSLEEKYFP